MNRLLLTFYGDDFTGSTDALESLALEGVPAVLFTEPPAPELLAARFPAAAAVGVAGNSRSLTPGQMEEVLPPAFAALRRLGAPICHYKVCSTFDSSPAIGSIGRAMDIGCRAFESEFVPVVVGAPPLRRYVAFGNLFATVGGETYRIDRHPIMSRHPVTPMREGDLRRHLAGQTERRVGLVDLLHLAQGDGAVDERLDALLHDGAGAVLFDTLDEGHLAAIGRTLWRRAAARPLFTVGSSGVEMALAALWHGAGLAPPPAPFSSPGPAEAIVVMSGSASSTTAEQIGWAAAHGYDCVRLDAPLLLDAESAEGELGRLCAHAVTALAAGRSVVFYSAQGPADPALAAAQASTPEGKQAGQQLGAAQGRLLRSIIERSGVRRICVAGGDTSSAAVRQLGISAMSVRYPLVRGVPLCRAYSDLPRLDGLELALKGGQMGAADFFGRVRAGK